jgi:hypothetical protein
MAMLLKILKWCSPVTNFYNSLLVPHSPYTIDVSHTLMSAVDPRAEFEFDRPQKMEWWFWLADGDVTCKSLLPLPIALMEARWDTTRLSSLTICRRM